jgi:hypothetical protein
VQRLLKPPLRQYLSAVGGAGIGFLTGAAAGQPAADVWFGDPQIGVLWGGIIGLIAGLLTGFVAGDT